MSDRMIIARDGWGDDVPDWVCALVKACDCKGASQNSVAGRVGVTGAVISQVLRNKYPARTDRIEARVRAIFLDGQISCPALGEITSEDCLNWRDAAHKLNSVSPARVRMFRACKTCRRNANDNEDDIA